MGSKTGLGWEGTSSGLGGRRIAEIERLDGLGQGNRTALAARRQTAGARVRRKLTARELVAWKAAGTQTVSLGRGPGTVAGGVSGCSTTAVVDGVRCAA